MLFRSAVGMKLGSRDIVLRDNYVHDLGDDPTTHAFSLGGTGFSTPNPEDHTAFGLHLENNRVERFPGILAQLVSCSGCSVTGNQLSDLGAGVVISASATSLPQCEGSPDGCGPNEDAVIEGNVMRRMNGNGDPDQANVFIGVEDEGEAGGFTAGTNVYCVAEGDEARFVWEGAFIGFDEWVTTSGIDETSEVVNEDDPRCDLDL